MYSPEEIIELAVRTEVNGKEFYDYAAERAKDRDLKGIFEFLAAQEDIHRTKFESLRGEAEKLIFPEEWGEIEPYLSTIVESAFFLGSDKSPVKAIKAKSSVEALEFALQFEKETILFYNEVEALIGGKSKKVVSDIINEEKNHVRMISKLLTDIGKKSPTFKS